MRICSEIAYKVFDCDFIKPGHEKKTALQDKVLAWTLIQAAKTTDHKQYIDRVGGGKSINKPMHSDSLIKY